MKRTMLAAIFWAVLLLTVSWAVLPGRAFSTAFAPPTATSFSVALSNVSASAIQLNGADVDGTALTFSIVSNPGAGTLSNLDASTGAVVYTPSSTTYTGTTTFTYKVTSGGQDSNTATVTVTVTNQKTRVIDTLQNPDGSPMQGTVTFVMSRVDSVSPVGPNGLIPVGASVSSTLNNSGQFDVQLIPSRSLSPVTYYQLWFQDARPNIRPSPLGVYDIPASTTSITLSGRKLTDTGKASRQLFASYAQVEALINALANGAAAYGAHPIVGAGHNDTLNLGISTGALLMRNASNQWQGLASAPGVLKSTGGLPFYQAILDADLPSTLANKTLTNPIINGGTISGLSFAGTILNAPTITNGTATNLALTTPTINSPTISGNMGVSGTVTAANFVGNGAGITGLAGATGGVSNTGSTTVIGDSDNNGVGVIALQTGNTTRLEIAPTTGEAKFNDYATFSGRAAPSVSASGKASFYFDSTANKLLISENGGAYAEIGSAAAFDAGYKVRNYASLSAAVNAIDTASATLFISTPISLSADLTIPRNINLEFTNGGKITIAANATLTINGTLNAPAVQIFETQGSGATVATTAGSQTITAGSAIFASNDVGKYIQLGGGVGIGGSLLHARIIRYISTTQVEISTKASNTIASSNMGWNYGKVFLSLAKTPSGILPEWWGAKGDTTGDDAGAWLQAVASAYDGNGRGRLVKGSSGYYTIKSAIAIVNAQGVKIEGEGGSQSATFIDYQGGTGSAFLFQNSRNNTLKYMRIKGTDSATVSGVSVFWDGANGFNGNNNTFDELVISDFGVGVEIGNGGVPSVSENALRKVQVDSCTVAAVKINSQNAQNTRIMDSRFSSSPKGVWCVQCGFNLRDTLFAHNTDADLHLESLLIASFIDGAYTEQSNQFIRTGGPAGFPPSPLIVRGSSIYSNVLNAIDYKLGGNLTLTGNFIGITTNPNKVAVGGQTQVLNSSGNAFMTAAAENPFVISAGTAAINSFNDKVCDSAGVVSCYTLSQSEIISGASVNNTVNLTKATSGTSNRNSALAWKHINLSGGALTTLWTFTNEYFGQTNSLGIYNNVANDTAWSINSSNNFGVGLAPNSTTDRLSVGGGNISINTAGNALKIKTGANACAGTATLSSGTVTVTTTCTPTIGSNGIITLTPFGSSTGAVRISSHTGGTSFVITSTDASSSDVVQWIITKTF